RHAQWRHGVVVVLVGVLVVPVGVLVVVVVVVVYLPTTMVTVEPCFAWLPAVGVSETTVLSSVGSVTVVVVCLTVKPAALSALVAAAGVSPVTVGTLTIGGAWEITRLTVEPAGEDPVL